MCLNYHLALCGLKTYVAIKTRVHNQQRANEKFLEQEKNFWTKKNISRSRKRFFVIVINKTPLYAKN